MTIRVVGMLTLILSFGWFSMTAEAAPGDLDLTFNGTGKVTTDVSAGNNTVNSMAIQADGKIIATGNANNGTNDVFSLVRYNADGTLDTSLDGDGILLTPVGTTGFISWGLVVQPDGKIVVSGYGNSTTSCRLIRYNPNGSLDPTFSGDGIANCNIGILRRNAITLQTDGKIIIGGVSSGFPNFAVQRLNADGTLDTTFGTLGNGLVVIDFGSSFIYEETNGVTVRPDGKIVAVGYVQTGTLQFDYAVAVLNANGTPDTSFDGDGKVQTSTGGLSQANSVAAQPDNKIIVAGFAPDAAGDFSLARYNTDGSLDTTFDMDGIVTTPFLISEEVQSVKLLPNGKIIAAGNTNGDTQNFSFAIARYNPNGSLDTTFSADGKQTIDFGTGGEFGNSLAIDQNGRYVIAGGANNLFAITRIQGDQIVPAESEFDFDGDGKSDLSVFRPAEGNWYINRSSNSQFYGAQFGLASDKLAPADYDGDGKTDIAVWRDEPANPDRSYFYIFQSSTGTVRVEQFGRTGDLPLTVGDWDGDGKADPSVYRNGANGGQSFFYYRPSGQPAVDFISIAWGVDGDKPVRGDYDSDGKLDTAVFRPSNATWYIRQSSDSQLRVDNWGLTTDKFVPADYDADGKTDLAVFRNGTWYIKQSSNNQLRAETFGLATDILVPADYDGDGKVDIAVFRNGTWYLSQSTSGFSAQAFGSATDLPIPKLGN